MSDMLPVTIWTIAAAALTGLLLALLGSLELHLARQPAVARASLSRLLWMLNVVLLPLVIAAGVLVDQWGLRPMMILGPVLLALSLLSLSVRLHQSQAAIALFGAAAAAAALSVTSVALMPRALFGEAELVPSLMLGMVFVGLGALVSAPLLDLLTRSLGRKGTLALAALAALAPAFLAAFPSDERLAQVAWPGGLDDLVRQPVVWLGAAVFFFYAPLEGFVSVWTKNYLEHLHEPPGKATSMLMGFWGSLTLSRVLVAVIQHGLGLQDGWGDWVLLPVISFTVVVWLGNLMAMTGVGKIRVSLCLLGLSMGPLLPLVIGLVFAKLIPQGSEDAVVRVAMPGTAYAILCAVGSVGGLVLSPVIGFCARARTVTTALLVPTIMALLLWASAVVFTLQPGR